MKMTQEKIAGIIGSAFFCGIVALILYFTFLYTKIEAPEEGVLVNFGTIDWASGAFEPRAEKNNPKISVERKQNTSPQTEAVHSEKPPPVITQNTEQTAAIDAAEQEKERKRLEKERLEQQRRAEEQRINMINQQMQGAFGAGDLPEGNEGTASSGFGNQGSTQGNAAVGSYVGVGGYGGFDLSGRTLGSGGLPRPSYSVQEAGRIVINIIVDPQGNVLSAEIGRGTNIDNNAMRKSALEAARKAKFNSITGNNNQSGTITYNYKLI
jgi:TonB family protein